MTNKKTGFNRVDGEQTANQAYKAEISSANYVGEPPTFKDWLAAQQKDGKWLKAEPETIAETPKVEPVVTVPERPWRPMGMDPLAFVLVTAVAVTVVYYGYKMFTAGNNKVEQ